ncbi:hypothetical protein, partial [Sphingomonas solaris]|uniref:hypothetical protein n=1 Tax=Alterirhizorhabdus solaris TaxID=2529389 RepID=UPI001396A484
IRSRLKWALGIERSELEVQAFAGVIYAAAEGSRDRIPAMRALALALQRIRARPDMPAAMACERLYYEALPPADRRAELWALRDRFARVATPSALASYNANRMADIAAMDDGQIAAEVRSLLSYTHKSYQLTQVREVAAGRLKRWLLWSTVVFLILLACAVFNWAAVLGITAPRSLFLGLALVMLAGAVGAVMSVTRRLQGAIDSQVLAEDPLFEIAALELGRSGIMLSCLTGSIFALVVFAIFYGDVGKVLGLNGGFLFPALSGHMLGRYAGIAPALGLAGDGDAARMLLIAFVAGFAERLVPDSIDRILHQGRK